MIRMLIVVLILLGITVLVGAITILDIRRMEREAQRERWQSFQFDIKRPTDEWYDYGTGKWFRRHR